MDEQVFDGAQAADEPLVDRYRTCTSADLAALYAELGGGARALEAQRKAIAAVLDEREAWQVDGARDMVGWVAATDALRRQGARSVVEVARALAVLPRVAAVAAEGRLSFDQLRPLCQLATPETDAAWAERGPSLEPGQVAAEAAKASRKRRERSEAEEGRRRLSFCRARGGGVRGSFYLPDVDADVLAAGLDRLAEGYEPAPGETWDPIHVRRADALVELASMSIADSAVGASAHLYVHAHAGAVGRDADGWATLADGTPIAQATLERLGCDATTQLLLHDESGAFTALGAVTRTVPRRVRRLLAHRDRTCRFPGCEMTLGLHAHHLRFWSRNGETEVWNLAMLCHRHHKLVHEGGWVLAGDPDDADGLTFTSPTGHRVTAAPMACTARVRERLVPDPPPGPAPADGGDEPDEPEPAASSGCDHQGAAARRARLDATRTRQRREVLRDLAGQAP